MKEYWKRFEKKDDEDRTKEVPSVSSFYHPTVDDVFDKLTASKTEFLAKEAEKALKSRGL